jgi:thiol-disulfide isomerase/thioredoxin
LDELRMTDVTNRDAEDNPQPRAPRRRVLPAAVLACVAIAGSVLYGTNGLRGKATAAECGATKAVAQRVDPLAHGEVAAFAAASTPQLMPAVAFNGPDGTPTSLAAFKGRTVLLNLWATWCVPCRREMPALDKLQAALGGPAFQVVAVNIDTARLDRPRQFLADVGAKSLGFYADPSADAFQALRSAGKVTGLPTSMLIDGRGCEIGTLAGPAEWDSPEALALVKAAIGS